MKDILGAQTWRKSNGELHREDGPAVIHSDGAQIWYKNGKQHCINGPSFIGYDGHKEWYLNGTEINEDLFLKLTQGPLNELPLYLGLGFDEFIAERLIFKK